jgi:probable F420-dependent oxidoreductase
MRFSFAESMCDPSHFLPLARALDEAGWTSFVVPDSICYPEVSDSKYPYTPDGNREFLSGKPFLEPFSLIPAMAAVTEKLRFTTFVVKLPIRHPVLVAKSVSSVAVLTGNRFGFGVGLSPWPEDYQVCGERWQGRGKRMDEMIEIIRGLLRGDFYQFHGKYYDIPSIRICPVPDKPLPILIGGHSEAALRRAAKLSDGWMHAGGDEGEMKAMIEKIHAMRRDFGRDKEPFEVHVISILGYSLDGIRQLEDMGVTDVIVGFRDAYNGPDQPLQEKIDAIRRYAADVIAKA